MTTESNDLQKHLEEILKKSATFMATVMATVIITVMATVMITVMATMTAMKKENATMKESLNTEEQNILNRDMKTEDDEEKKIVSQEEDNSYKKTKLDCCMRNHFEDGQRIRHTISKNINDTRIGIYNKVKDEIHYEGQKYKSPSEFAKEHFKQKRPDRTPETNGWTACEYEVDGKWIKIDRKCLKV